MKRGLFGGSFDPVHLGHRRMADCMIQALQLERVTVMPAWVSPFKTESATPAGDRLAMCRLAFEDDARYEISDMEICAGGKSYTVHTLEKLHEMYPDDTWVLLTGSDMLLSFDRWYEWQTIFRYASLCSVCRGDGDSAAQLRSYAQRVLCPYGTVTVVPFTPLPVSSTMIRDCLAAGRPTDGMLDEKVRRYIDEKGLYGVPKNAI